MNLKLNLQVIRRAKENVDYQTTPPLEVKTPISQVALMIRDLVNKREKLKEPEILKHVREYVTKIKDANHSISTCLTQELITTVGFGLLKGMYQMVQTKLFAMSKKKNRTQTSMQSRTDHKLMKNRRNCSKN